MDEYLVPPEQIPPPQPDPVQQMQTQMGILMVLQLRPEREVKKVHQLHLRIKNLGQKVKIIQNK